MREVPANINPSSSRQAHHVEGQHCSRRDINYSYKRKMTVAKTLIKMCWIKNMLFGEPTKL